MGRASYPWLAAATLWSLLLACGSDDPTDREPPDDADRNEQVAALCDAQAAVRCTRIHACGCPGADAQPQADCEAAWRTACAERIAADAAQGGDTSLAIDTAWLPRCEATLRAQAADCSPPRQGAVEAACAPLVSARADLDAPCDAAGRFCAGGDGVCGFSGRCEPLPGRDQPCAAEGPLARCAGGLLCVDAVCVPPRAAGDACASDVCEAAARCANERCTRIASTNGPCDDDRICSGATTCVDGRCVPLAAEDAACTAPGEIGPCGDDGICGGAPVRACVPAANEGDACAASEDCPPGLACIDALCQAGPGNGEPCVDGLWCGPSLACSMDGLCGPLPVLGEPCALGLFGPFTCADDLACVGRRCAPVPQEGQECGGLARCAEGLGCAFEGDISRCRPLRGAGDPCDNDTICATGTHCDFSAGRCRADLPLDAPCTQGNECGPTGSCVPNDGAFTCVPLPTRGEACLFDCEDGLVCAESPRALECFARVCEALR